MCVCANLLRVVTVLPKHTQIINEKTRQMSDTEMECNSMDFLYIFRSIGFNVKQTFFRGLEKTCPSLDPIHPTQQHCCVSDFIS